MSICSNDQVDLNNVIYECESLESDANSEDDKAEVEENGIYEPFNETVFDSNEENILDDALYVYDYLNMVLGIEEKNIIHVSPCPKTHFQPSLVLLFVLALSTSKRGEAQPRSSAIRRVYFGLILFILKYIGF